MTRLTEHDITRLDDTWQEYDRRLRAVTGTDLFTLAARTVGLKSPQVTGLRVAAIPVSSGEGLISGFAESLVSIARYLGFEGEVVQADAPGFKDARARFDLLIWADDDTYVAENVHTGTLAENGIATGKGFASALLHMLKQRDAQQAAKRETVLVLGAGPVGCAGAATLVCGGYDVLLCDFDCTKAQQAASEHIRPCTPEELPMLMPHIQALLDAAPTNRCLPREQVIPTVCVSAPCVPCIWADALPSAARLWHDPLQLGTAVMLLAAAFDRTL